MRIAIRIARVNQWCMATPTGAFVHCKVATWDDFIAPNPIDILGVKPGSRGAGFFQQGRGELGLGFGEGQSMTSH